MNGPSHLRHGERGTHRDKRNDIRRWHSYAGPSIVEEMLAIALTMRQARFAQLDGGGLPKHAISGWGNADLTPEGLAKRHC